MAMRVPGAPRAHEIDLSAFCRWRLLASSTVTTPRPVRLSGAPITSELSDLDREILALERLWWQYAGAKEAEIRRRFDMNATRYYQVLNSLLDREDALAYDPLLVKRLRRLRAQRQRSRSARRLGIDL